MNNRSLVGHRTIHSTVFCIAALAVWLMGARVASGGLYDSWGYSGSITFNGYTPTETLTNFPALVVLSNGCFSGSSAFAYSQFQSGSNDLAFTDSAGTSNLNYEIERWSTNGASYVWVQVPLLTSGTVIKAWWGKANTNAPGCTTNGAVWDVNYRAVWHLNRTNDVTSNGVSLALSGALADVSGKVDGAKSYDGNSGNYLQSVSFPTVHADFTLEAWLYPTNGGVVFCEIGQGGGWHDAHMAISSAGEIKIGFWNGGQYGLSLGSFALNAWYHVAMTYVSSGTLIGYVNGVKCNSATPTAKLYPSSALQYGVGKPESQNLGDTSAFDGVLDEARVSIVPRSSNWIWACYQTMASNTAFQAYGAARPSYQYSAPITFNGYTPTETLTNFPALVVLSNGCFSGSSAFAYSQFQSGSNDLAFTDSTGASSLNYEIETWNTNGASYVWVQVPLLSSGTVVKAWWGAAGQSAPACTTNGSVWTNGYVGVWHLPNGAALSLADSTTNGNAGSSSAVTATGGYVDGAGSFDGTASGYINVGTGASLNPAAVTVSALVKFSSLPNDYNMLFAKDGGGWATGSYILPVKSNGQLAPYVQASGTVSYDGGGAYTLTTGSWYYVAMTYSSSAGLKGFVNGLVDKSVAANGSLGTHNGAAWIGNDPISTGRRVNGVIDEVRVSSVARSTNWVWAECQTMASNTAFQTYGAASSSGGAGTPPSVTTLGSTNVATSGATVNGTLTSIGSAPVTAVSVYWGPTDGGTNAVNWSNRTDLAGGSWTNGAALSTNLTMASGQDCYYTFAASNSAGLTLASGSKYFITGPLTITATDASFGTNGADTATLVVSRPATCTGMAMTVYYATSGDATNGVHYTASPASGVLQIAAGATNATLILTPNVPLSGAARTATVTLLGTGLYPVGSPASANATEQLGSVVAPVILWSDGDGNGGWISSAGWNNIQTAINNATNNPATAGFVKLCGDFTRASGDATVGSLVISNNNITLSGGWDASFTTQSGRSVLNVNGANTANNEFRVLDVYGTNVTVSSMVVTNGYLLATTSGKYGAGMWVRETAIGTLLTNLVVAGNRGDKTFNDAYGGGIQIGTWGANPGPYGTRLSNCQIINNVAKGQGGGINLVDAGSKARPVVIENCTIAGNTANAGSSALTAGGGLFISAGAAGAPYVVIANSSISQNRSDKYGAGIGVWFANGNHITDPLVQLFGCLITSNYWLTGANAPDGNAIYQNAGGNTYLVNCTIADNTQPSQSAQAAGFSFSTVDYDYYVRLILINCVTRNNELGFKVNRLAPTQGHVAYADFQNTDLKESQYVEIDRVEGSLTNTTFAGAISTSGNATPAFRTLTTSGVLSQTIQQNIDGEPNFLGSGSAPYQLSATSSNALDNALKKAGSGYTYIDVDLDGSYTAGGDVIVAGTPPAGNNLVYTNDILGSTRVFASGMDRGAYEFPVDVNQQFTLTYTAGAGGTISGATNQTVTYGQTASAVTAVPNSGFNFSLWSDGVGSASRQDGPVTNALNVTANFVAAALPSISNLPPSNIGVGTATFNGFLVSTGDTPATVYVYWGPNDGTNNAAAWSNSAAFAQGAWAAASSVWTNMTGLPAQYCFYTFAVSNGAGLAWGVPASQSFCAGPVTVTNTDPICGATSTDTGTITISRPATCTNLALTVNFAYSGAATPGVNFTANPSGTSITLAAGQAETNIVFTPQAPWNVVEDKSVTVTLGGGLYPVGTPDHATCSLVKAVALCIWDGSTANWTNSTHWTSAFAGLLPVNGSTGLIASGQAQISTNSDLYNTGLGETAPAEVRIATNGTLLYRTETLGWPSLRDHHLVLDGGLLSSAQFAGPAGIIRYDHDLLVRGDSGLGVAEYRSDKNVFLDLYGALRDYDGTHTGRLISTNLTGDVYGQVWVWSTNNPFTGGWYVPMGIVGAAAPGALGTGDVTVTNRGTVAWGYSGFSHDAMVSDTNMPNITVWNGGTLAFEGTYSSLAHYSNAPNKAITLKSGGKIGTLAGDGMQISIDAPIQVSGNVTFEYTTQRKTLSFAGDMISDGPATITWDGKIGTDAGYTAITKTDNAYTGNWILTTVNPVTYLSVQNDGALGTGSVDLRSGAPVLDISKNLKLYNMIYGDGVLGTASRTLTLSPRYRNLTLTDAGVAPGTNWASAAGTLAVPGNLTLTNLVNYDGNGHDAYAKVNILVTTNALGAGTNSMVQVTGNLNGLTNADLTVSASTRIPDGIYTIVTSGNDISAQRFHSTTLNGVAGSVLYNANSVQLRLVEVRGTTFRFR